MARTREQILEAKRKYVQGGRMPCRGCKASMKGYHPAERYCSDECRIKEDALPNEVKNNKSGKIDPYWLVRGTPSNTNRGYIVTQEA